MPGVSIDQWWLLYDDPQLEQLVTAALARGFAVREAFARLEEARAIRSSALARFLVQGDLQGSGEVRRTETLSSGGLFVPALPDMSLTDLFAPITTTTSNVSIPLSWEFDLFGRRQASGHVADADLAAARFEYEGTRALLIADVARSLFEARGLAAQLKDARATLAMQRSLAKVIEERSVRGLASASDFDQTLSDLASSEAQSAELEAALDASQRALLALLGEGTAPIGSLTITPVMPDAPSLPVALPGELLVRRPDVRQADARMTAATGRVRLAELAFMPTITPQATLGFSSQTGGLGTTAIFGAVGASLVAPVFDRARLHSELRTSSARGEQAVLAYERSVQTAYSEADQAFSRLAAARRRVDILERGLGRAQRAYDAALERYSLGIGDLPTTLRAEQTFRVARTGLTVARVDALLRSVEAFKALGGGWKAPRITASRAQK